MSHLKATMLSREQQIMRQLRSRAVPPRTLSHVPNRGDLELKSFANQWPRGGESRALPSPSPSKSCHIPFVLFLPSSWRLPEGRAEPTDRVKANHGCLRAPLLVSAHQKDSMAIWQPPHRCQPMGCHRIKLPSPDTALGTTAQQAGLGKREYNASQLPDQGRLRDT